MSKDCQADTSIQVPVIETNSDYQHIYAHGKSRLHNGHVFNTVNHSTSLLQSHMLYFSHDIDVNRPDYRSPHSPNDKPVPQAESSMNQDLIRACDEGQGKARLAYLLSKGADIEFRSEANCTPPTTQPSPVRWKPWNSFSTLVQTPTLSTKSGKCRCALKSSGAALRSSRHCLNIKPMPTSTVFTSGPLHMPLVLKRIWLSFDCCTVKVLISRRKDMSTLAFGRYLCMERKDQCSVTPFNIALPDRSQSHSVTAKS